MQEDDCLEWDFGIDQYVPWHLTNEECCVTQNLLIRIIGNIRCRFLILALLRSLLLLVLSLLHFLGFQILI